MKRYDTMGFESEHGVWVRWADYDAEVARLRSAIKAIEDLYINRGTLDVPVKMPKPGECLVCGGFHGEGMPCPNLTPMSALTV